MNIRMKVGPDEFEGDGNIIDMRQELERFERLVNAHLVTQQKVAEWQSGSITPDPPVPPAPSTAHDGKEGV